MATSVYSWSTTAASNGSADSNQNWSEGQSPPSLNNSARALLAGLKAWFDGAGGAATQGGSSSDYTITNAAAGAWSAYAAGQIIALKANHTNDDTAVTLAVDGLAAKAIKTCDGGNPAIGDIVSGGIYLLAYDGTNFQILNTLAGGSYQPLDATLTALAAISWTSGVLIPTLTAADTFTLADGATFVRTTGAQTVGGAKTLTSALTVNLNGASLPATITGGVVQYGNADSSPTIAVFDAFASFSAVVFRHARGTAASPSATQTGDTIGSVGARAYGATGYASGSRVSLNLVAAENWTDSAQGTYGVLLSTSNGSTTNTARFRWGDPSSALELGFRGAPQNTSLAAADYTLVADDAGRQFYHTDAGTDTLTIPADSSVPFPLGTVIQLVNGNGAGVVTVAITTDTLRRGDGVAGTGSRSIAANSVVSLIKVASTEWYITGSGIS